MFNFAYRLTKTEIQLENMKNKEIKSELLKGQQFGNESADWFTLNRCHIDGGKVIVIRGEYHFYKTVDSFSKRISQLIRRGY